MAHSIRTSVRNFLEQEGVATLLFRILVAGILVLVLTRVGSVVSTVNGNISGIVASIG